MENHSNHTHSRYHCAYTGRQQVKQIVDDDSYHYPSLLRWLKRNLKLIQPVNNPNYNPHYPTAS